MLPMDDGAVSDLREVAQRFHGCLDFLLDPCRYGSKNDKLKQQ